MPETIAVLLVVFATVVAWWLLTRRRRQRRTGFVDLRALRQLSWDELEILVADYFVREGFVLRVRGGKAVDFVMEKGGRNYLVQCKHWRARCIDVDEVRDVFGHMAATNAAAAYVIGSGRYTDEALRFASGKRIELVDGEGLVRMIEEVQQDPSEITQSRLGAMRDAEQTQPRRVILCPRCGRPMNRRRERGGSDKKGAREYYGCSRYPTCKGRREIA